ncbi:hypothetical protein GCM10027276_28320 [Comamonas piscis]
MSNIVITKRGEKHVIFSVIGFLLFVYIVYGLHSLSSKTKFDSAIFVLITTGISMLIFSLVHAVLGYLMIFRYITTIDNSKNKKVLKVLNYESEPKELFVVIIDGRTVIADQI